MRRKAIIKLSEHWKGDTYAGFKKCIGGRMFYFGQGTDRSTAERQALALLSTWQRLKAAGAVRWTEEAMRTRSFALGADPSQVEVGAARGVGESITSAVDTYCADLVAKVPGQLSEGLRDSGTGMPCSA